MPTHPGHPALAETDTLSVSRGYINDALDSISTQSITATTTLDPDNGRVILVSPASNITITLPDPAASDRNANIVLIFKRLTAGGTCTLDVASSGTIDGRTTVTLNTQYDKIVVFNDGTAGTWYIEE